VQTISQPSLNPEHGSKNGVTENEGIRDKSEPTNKESETEKTESAKIEKDEIGNAGSAINVTGKMRQTLRLQEPLLLKLLPRRLRLLRRLHLRALPIKLPPLKRLVMQKEPPKLLVIRL
jgi:hypothetical protein